LPAPEGPRSAICIEASFADQAVEHVAMSSAVRLYARSALSETMMDIAL